MSAPAAEGILEGDAARERLAAIRAQFGGERDPMAAAWAGMPADVRGRILAAAGCAWLGVSGDWSDIPGQYRAEVKRRCKALRDLLLRVFPVGIDGGDSASGR